MRFALIAVLLAGPCAAAPALTTVQDTLYKADGSRFEGVAQIEWKSFRAADGSEIPQQMLAVKIVAGSLRVALVPTANAAKPTTYTVKFNSDGRVQFVEYWSIPQSPTPLRLKDVRAQQQAGDITDGAPAAISDIAGLRAELDVRPSKGSAFANSRAAVINASGTIDGAIGNSGDCIHVDGTSGPCGSTGTSVVFVDGATPTGAINGTNASFTLASAPSPATSLNLFRNGLLLRQSVDYTISGSTVTMASGSIPASGDVVQAWYRLAGTGTPTVLFNENETPTGVVDGSNGAFSLQATPSPAVSLQLFRNGMLQKAGVDYMLSTNVITFAAGAQPRPGDVLQAYYRR